MLLHLAKLPFRIQLARAVQNTRRFSVFQQDRKNLSNMDNPYVIREDLKNIATLTLNRPKQLNSLSEEMLEELQSRLDSIKTDKTVKVVILAGKGRAFSAGHNLKQMRSKPSRQYYQKLFNQCGNLMKTIIHLPQPVIASVHGIATAAGCQLVSTCDLAVVSDSSRFATSGINAGLFCSTPAVPLSRNVGRKKAFEMLFTGDFIDAGTALNCGLVNRVVSEAELKSATFDLAQKIASKSPTAVAIGKQMFYRQLTIPDIGQALHYAAEVMACNMMDKDAEEGIDAFIQKRHPKWQEFKATEIIKESNNIDPSSPSGGQNKSKL